MDPNVRQSFIIFKQIPLTMRTIFLLALLLTFTLTAYSQGATLAANNVNVRSEPHLDGKVVAKLPIGTELEVVSDDLENLTIKGIEAPWAQVNFTHEGNTMTGYLWSGFFSEQGDELQNGVQLFWRPFKAKEHEYWTEIFYQIRAVKGNEELSSLEFSGIGSLGTSRYLTVHDGRGVPKVKNVLEFEFSDDFCGGAFGRVVCFWDGQDLHFVKEQREGADAPVWSEEYFIYPSDSNGVAGELILVNIEGGEDEEGKESIDRWEKRFAWKAGKLVEKK